MSEIEFETEREIYINDVEGKSSLPDSLREWLVYPDDWVKERDAIQMQNDLLQAERDELLQYVKNLKKLAIFLIRKTELSERNLSNINFDSAEKYLPGYIREVIEVDIQALGLLS